MGMTFRRTATIVAVQGTDKKVKVDVSWEAGKYSLSASSYTTVAGNGGTKGEICHSKLSTLIQVDHDYQPDKLKRLAQQASQEIADGRGKAVALVNEVKGKLGGNGQ